MLQDKREEKQILASTLLGSNDAAEELETLSTDSVVISIINDHYNIKVADIIALIPAYQIIKLDFKPFIKEGKLSQITACVSLRECQIKITTGFTSKHHESLNIQDEVIMGFITKIIVLNLKCEISLSNQSTSFISGIYSDDLMMIDYVSELQRFLHFLGFDVSSSHNLSQYYSDIRLAKAMNRFHPHIKTNERLPLLAQQIKGDVLPFIKEQLARSLK